MLISYYVLSCLKDSQTVQGSTIDLKRVFISPYVLKNLGVRNINGKNYKQLKNTSAIRAHRKQRMKNLFDFFS